MEKLAKSTKRPDIRIDCGADEISLEKLRKYKTTYKNEIKNLRFKIKNIEKIERRISK